MLGSELYWGVSKQVRSLQGHPTNPCSAAGTPLVCLVHNATPVRSMMVTQPHRLKIARLTCSLQLLGEMRGCRLLTSKSLLAGVQVSMQLGDLRPLVGSLRCQPLGIPAHDGHTFLQLCLVALLTGQTPTQLPSLI